MVVADEGAAKTEVSGEATDLVLMPMHGTVFGPDSDNTNDGKISCKSLKFIEGMYVRLLFTYSSASTIT